MFIKMQRFFLLTFGLLFCILGCTRDRANVVMPNEVSSVMDSHEPMDPKASFEMNLLPILTAKCALAGCHVADGPEGLDLRTYESFKAGSDQGPIFIPGNAAESEVVEEIVSEAMPLGGPPLPAEEIQLFKDWINQQDPSDFDYQNYDDDDHDDDDDDDDDDHDDDDDDDDDDHDDDDDDDDDDHDDGD